MAWPKFSALDCFSNIDSIHEFLGLCMLATHTPRLSALTRFLCLQYDTRTLIRPIVHSKTIEYLDHMRNPSVYLLSAGCFDRHLLSSSRNRFTLIMSGGRHRQIGHYVSLPTLAIRSSRKRVAMTMPLLFGIAGPNCMLLRNIEAQHVRSLEQFHNLNDHAIPLARIDSAARNFSRLTVSGSPIWFNKLQGDVFPKQL